MENYNEIKEALNKQFNNFDTFFKENKKMLLSYILSICNESLEKRKYKFNVVPTKESIMIETYAGQKCVKVFEITKQKIETVFDESWLPE